MKLGGDDAPSPLALTLALALIEQLETADGQEILAELLRRHGWRCKPPRTQREERRH
jgi:hypothetical protein